MKSKIILTISLLTVVLLVNCAPTAASEETQSPLVNNESEVTLTAAPTVFQPQATPTKVPTMEPLPTEAPTEVSQVVATSRGPDLEATDPGAYTRASGELQLVEFIAFW